MRIVIGAYVSAETVLEVSRLAVGVLMGVLAVFVFVFVFVLSVISGESKPATSVQVYMDDKNNSPRRSASSCKALASGLAICTALSLCTQWHDYHMGLTGFTQPSGSLIESSPSSASRIAVRYLLL